MIPNNTSFINFTPNGMIPDKASTPYVPVSVNEIVDQVLMAKEQGAAIAHIHAREADGKPTWKGEIYGNIIYGIRQAEGNINDNDNIIICVSTSGRDWPEFEKRSECLQLVGKEKPDMASLTLSSLNFSRTASMNSPEMIQKLARKMLETGIKPELEVFDSGMINYAKYLSSKGILDGPFYFNLLFGNIATAQADALSLGQMTSILPDNSMWAAAGLGASQLKMNMLGMLSNGGIRIGIEDNLWFDHEKRQLASNSDLLARINRVAKELEVRMLAPAEVRSLLNLNLSS